MTESRIREVYSARDHQEAHFIKTTLEDAGIEARVVEDHLQTALGDLPASAIAPRVRVRSEDADKARKIIVDWRSHQGAIQEHASERICSKCSVLNEPTFEICWHSTPFASVKHSALGRAWMPDGSPTSHVADFSPRSGRLRS